MSTEKVSRVKHTPYLDKALFHLHFPFARSFVFIRTFRITIFHSNIYKFKMDGERNTQKKVSWDAGMKKLLLMHIYNVAKLLYVHSILTHYIREVYLKAD